MFRVATAWARAAGGVAAGAVAAVAMSGAARCTEAETVGVDVVPASLQAWYAQSYQRRAGTAAWDANWDFRQGEKQGKANRHFILVRHGQYHSRGPLFTSGVDGEVGHTVCAWSNACALTWACSVCVCGLLLSVCGLLLCVWGLLLYVCVLLLCMCGLLLCVWGCRKTIGQTTRCGG